MKAFITLLALAAPAAAQVTITETIWVDTQQGTPPPLNTNMCLDASDSVGFPMPEVPGYVVSSQFLGTVTWEQTGAGPNGELLFDPTLTNEWAISPSACGTGYEKEVRMLPRINTCYTDPTGSVNGPDGGQASWPTFTVCNTLGGIPQSSVPFAFPAISISANVDTVARWGGPCVGPLAITVGHDIWDYDKIGTWTELGWVGFWDPNVGGFTNTYTLTGWYTVTYVVDQPDQTVVCQGRNPQSRTETLAAYYQANGDILLYSEDENPNSWGFLFFCYGGTVLPGAWSNFVCISNPLGLSRSVTYQSNAQGQAVLRDVALFPGTWHFQRVHRESDPNWHMTASSGRALRITIQ